MGLELLKEKYQGAINTVSIGADPSIKIGGQNTMPLLNQEGQAPNPPVTAMEIFDCKPDDWPEQLKAPFSNAINDPVSWAKKCVDDFGAKALCVRLVSVHDDFGARPKEESVKTLEGIVKAVRVPFIVLGSGDDERDNQLLPLVSQALKGQNLLLGAATQANYKTLTATCLADGHSLIAESPIDVNIAKQLNILIADMGLNPERIVMHPTTASLGYGMEYSYSIMERSRLAAFQGDKMLSMPFILFAGQETWRTKEAKESLGDVGINWELGTSVSMIQAGGDLIVVRHPESHRALQKYISAMTRRA